MGELKVKDKDIVVPGEILAVGMDYLPAGGAVRENESIIAQESVYSQYSLEIVPFWK